MLMLSNRSAGTLSDEPESCLHAGAGDTPLEERYVDIKSELEQKIASGSMVVGDWAHKTRLIKRLGGGSFGEVYLGTTVSGTNTEDRVAVKIEPSCYPSQCLLHEGDVYRKLAGSPGIPAAHWFGMHSIEYSVLVMDLLGPTLYDVWNRVEQRFSMKTLLMLVDQTLETIGHVHSCGFVHRDISPSNFMVDSDVATAKRVYLIDFGNAKKVVNAHFWSSSRGRFSFPKPIVGTPRFTSVFAHAGCEAAYRDDMESLGYMWIYFAQGQLPWQGIRDCSGPAKVTRIGQMKASIPLDELCAGMPEEFAAYMVYARSLRPTDMPDHTAVRNMFRDLGERLDVEYDWKFDWIERISSSSTEATTSSGIGDSPVTRDLTEPGTPVSK